MHNDIEKKKNTFSSEPATQNRVKQVFQENSCVRVLYKRAMLKYQTILGSVHSYKGLYFYRIVIHSRKLPRECTSIRKNVISYV